MDGFITFFVITFIFLPVIFCVLFIVFLTKTIQRGKRIKELEKEINDLKSGNANQAAQNTNAQSRNIFSCLRYNLRVISNRRQRQYFLHRHTRLNRYLQLPRK